MVGQKDQHVQAGICANRLPAFTAIQSGCIVIIPKNIKTINNKDFQIKNKYSEFTYQSRLTQKLDHYSGDFDQNVINEIVLWKVNRYSELSVETLALINSIGEHFNKELTRSLLSALLNEKGIQLPMASTILRFKSPKIYQIIDQRVYRILYREELKLSTYASEKNIQEQVDLYLRYLEDLRAVCKQKLYLERNSPKRRKEIKTRANIQG